jgi:hypothetical protein
MHTERPLKSKGKAASTTDVLLQLMSLEVADFVAEVG